MKNHNFGLLSVALTVVVVGIVLFGALALALNGRVLSKPNRTVRVNFHDVTGVRASSQVKYAGATAGVVAGVRILTPDESKASGDPRNAVQLTLALDPEVPPMTEGVKVSISADTLLSDKFVSISGGVAGEPPLAPDAVLQGIRPTTFDELARSIDGAIKSLREVFGSEKGSTQSSALLGRIDSVLGKTESLLGKTESVVSDAGVIMTDGRDLISANKDQIAQTIARLDKAAVALESLALRSEGLVKNNEKNLNAALSDLKVTSENLKVTSTYSKFLLRDLSEKPSRLIWGGGKPPALPSEQQILRARGPVPTP